MALFEFSSSNGYSSFNLFYECRRILITEIEDGNQSHFSYLVDLPYDLQSNTSCEERGFEELKTGHDDCITDFQGKKYSMI